MIRRYSHEYSSLLDVIFCFPFAGQIEFSLIGSFFPPVSRAYFIHHSKFLMFMGFSSSRLTIRDLVIQAYLLQNRYSPFDDLIEIKFHMPSLFVGRRNILIIYWLLVDLLGFVIVMIVIWTNAL